MDGQVEAPGSAPEAKADAPDGRWMAYMAACLLFVAVLGVWPFHPAGGFVLGALIAYGVVRYSHPATPAGATPEEATPGG